MTGPQESAALFVDLDGTVRLGIDQLGRWVNGPEDVQLFPEAVPLMRAWRDSGGAVIGVTNQAGPALGHMSWEAWAAVEAETIRQADGQLDQVLTCTHRPDHGCWCRKPAPGLLYAGAAWLQEHRHGVAPRIQCLMVGDMDTDRQAAERAGIPFQWAHEWRAMTPAPRADR